MYYQILALFTILSPPVPPAVVNAALIVLNYKVIKKMIGD